jgi:hypothetical protein
MKYLSRNDLEGIAAQITNQYQRLPRFNGQLVQYIDPEILARELYGLRIDYRHLSKDRSTLGLTSCSEMGIGIYDDDNTPRVYYLDGRTLLVEKALHEDPAKLGRYHFTLAHETAHQILAQQFPQHWAKIQNRVVSYRGKHQSYPIDDWEEWQADNLASALLMPADIVWTAMSKYGLAPQIKILNRLYRPREYEGFCQMADTLGVSKQALAIRLKRLGWLDKEYLRDPQALIDVDKEDCDEWNKALV